MHFPGRFGATTGTLTITFSPGGVSPIVTRSGTRQPSSSPVGLIRSRKRLCQSTDPTLANAHTLVKWAFSFTRVPSGMVTSATNLLESPGINASENPADGDDAVVGPKSSGDHRPRTETPRIVPVAPATASHSNRCRRPRVTPSFVVAGGRSAGRSSREPTGTRSEDATPRAGESLITGIRSLSGTAQIVLDR